MKKLLKIIASVILTCGAYACTTTPAYPQEIRGYVTINTPNARVIINSNNGQYRQYIGNRPYIEEYRARRDNWMPYYPAPGSVAPSQSRFYNPHYHNPELRYSAPPGYALVPLY